MSRTEHITIARPGGILVGDLYVPTDGRSSGGTTAVIVQGSLTSVKEQMPAEYARRLADRGFLALALDYAHYGASSGEPRQLEAPTEKLLDLRAAVTWLLGRPDVDRVAMVGVCTSAGNAAYLAASDSRLAAMATVAGMLPDPALYQSIYGADGVAARRAAAREAQARWGELGEQTLRPAYSETDSNAINYNPTPGAYDYYLNPARGGVPQYTNALDVASLDEWRSFDPIGQAGSITIPTLVVHSDGCAFPDQARRFHEQLAGPKRIAWLDGTHFDYYDSPAHIDQAVAEIIDLLHGLEAD